MQTIWKIALRKITLPILIGTFTPGMSIKECMDGSQCSHKRPARDDKGDFFILSKPQHPQTADNEDTVYIDAYKVYMNSDKAISMVEIKPD